MFDISADPVNESLQQYPIRPLAIDDGAHDHNRVATGCSVGPADAGGDGVHLGARTVFIIFALNDQRRAENLA
jgi:hypothetical protein